MDGCLLKHGLGYMRMYQESGSCFASHDLLEGGLWSRIGGVFRACGLFGVIWALVELAK